MGKWLAIGGVGLVLLLLLMWRELDSSSAAAPVVDKPAPTTTITKPAIAAPKAPVAPVIAEAEAVPDDKKKLDPMGDPFFYAFTEYVPKVLSKEAAVCYNGKLGTKHRNSKLKLTFNVRVRSGVVTVQDLKVDTSTLNDPALESCFIQAVSRAGWTNPQLPDYDWPDELVIRPERGLKKYVKENVEYVGEPAQKGYTIAPHSTD
jgi:hypothetical protein